MSINGCAVCISVIVMLVRMLPICYLSLYRVAHKSVFQSRGLRTKACFPMLLDSVFLVCVCSLTTTTYLEWRNWRRANLRYSLLDKHSLN